MASAERSSDDIFWILRGGYASVPSVVRQNDQPTELSFRVLRGRSVAGWQSQGLEDLDQTDPGPDQCQDFRGFSIYFFGHSGKMAWSYAGALADAAGVRAAAAASSTLRREVPCARVLCSSCASRPLASGCRAVPCRWVS